jgi:hypothetical protein
MGVQTCSAAGSWNACQCGTPDGDAGMVDAFVDPTVDAFATRDAGMERSTSMMVGPAGGELTLEGATLTVPAGALTTTTELRMIATTTPGPAGYTLYSPVFRFEPAGTTFAMPATIRMPYTGNRARAALFWSQADGHWERIGGVPDATHVVGLVSHFSDGFVADGVDYREAPGATCSVTRAWANSTMRPSALGIVFTASDCDGRPVTGLTAADVEIREDDLLLGSETPLTLEAVDNPEIVINLAFDMSASTAPLLPDVIAGAQAFIDRLRTVRARPKVGLWVFDSSAGTEWEPFTRDLDRVRTRIGELAAYVPTDPISTNLFQGTLSSLQVVRGAAAFERQFSANGVAPLSFSVLFTDGADTTGAVSEASVIADIARGADMAFGIGLRSRDYDGAALRRIAPAGVIDAPDRATLPREMARVAAMIDDVVQSTYTARYCTPKRAGTHPVRIGLVSSADDRTAAPVVSLNAEYLVPGCTAATIAATCDRPTCGGLFCGGCADNEICNGALATMPAHFVELNQCRVYDDPCGGSGQTRCSGSCVSTDYDRNHCGACGLACASGQTCFSGACVEQRSVAVAGLGPTVSLTVNEGSSTGTLYITARNTTDMTFTSLRMARRPGASPQALGAGIYFVEESPTHAYFRDATRLLRVPHESAVQEVLPGDFEYGCDPYHWASADEYRCLDASGVRLLNIVTGTERLEVPSARWESFGYAFGLTRDGIYVRAHLDMSAVYWVSRTTSEVRYAGRGTTLDANGRLLFHDVSTGASEVSDGPRGISWTNPGGVVAARTYGNDRGWFFGDGFWSFANGENARPTPCTAGSTARGCLYAPPTEFSHTLSFDVHVCERGEACPGSDVCCPNPTGNDFCAPSCS